MISHISTLIRRVHEDSLYADFISCFPAAQKRQLVLDVGAGTGLTSAYLRYHGYIVTVVEPDLQSIQSVRSLFENLKLDGEFLQVASEEMDLQEYSGRFDTVLFHASLHHCHNPKHALLNAWKNLKPGGTLFLICEPILSFFRSKEWHRRMLEKNKDKIYHDIESEHVYRVHEYVEMMRDAGFTNIRVNIGPSMTGGRLGPLDAGWYASIRRFVGGLVEWLGAIGLSWPVKKLLDTLSWGTRIFTANRYSTPSKKSFPPD